MGLWREVGFKKRGAAGCLVLAKIPKQNKRNTGVEAQRVRGGIVRMLKLQRSKESVWGKR